MTAARRVLANIVYIGMARGMEIFVNLINISIVTRYLGVTQYSDYVLIMTYVGVLIPLSFAGVERIIIREIAKKKENADKYLGIGLVIRWIMSLVVLVLLSIIVYFVDMSKEMTAGIYVVAFAQIIMSSSLLYQAIFKGFERMGFEPLVSIVFNVVLLGSVLFVTYYDLGFVSVFWCMFIANVARLCLAIVITNKNFVRPKINFKEFPLMLQILKSSLLLGLSVLIVHLTFHIDVILLKMFSNAKDVSLFYVANSLIRALTAVPVIIITVLMPILSRRALAEDNTRLFEAYQSTFKFLIVISLFIAINVFVFSDNIIGLLFNADFYASYSALKVLSWTVVPLSLVILLNHFLIAVNLERVLIYFSVLCLLTKIAIGIVLIPSWGYIGASITTLLSDILLFLVTFYYVSRKFFPIQWMSVLIKPVFASIVMGLLLFILKENGFGIFIFLPASVVYISTLMLLKVFSEKELYAFKRS